MGHHPRTISGVGALFAAVPDVVHIHSPLLLGVLAQMRARRLGVPVVYTNHYLPVNVNPARRRRPGAFDGSFYAYVIGFSNRCNYVTAPSATALGLLREHGLRIPSMVISNGVDAGTYSPGPADERLRDRYGLRRDRPLILSVGRLSAEKRIDVLIGAAARLTREAQIVIAGSGPQEAELVRHGRSGFLFRRGCAEEMAVYLDTLAGDPGLRRGMAAAGSRIVSAHGRHAALRAWESLYGLLARAGHRGRPR